MSQDRKGFDTSLTSTAEHKPQAEAHSHGPGTNTMMGRFGRFVVRVPLPVMVVSLAAALVMAAVGMSQFSINTDPPQGK
jgi:uncharacterized membrane protein YdfJ with MMPL/SSD domain